MTDRDERQRLHALRQFGAHLGDGPQDFHRLATLAARSCQAPIGLISLLDLDTQWLVGRVGVDASSIPRDQAPCASTVEAGTSLAVEDLQAVPESIRDRGGAFGDARGYLGVPLPGPNGEALGTVAVMDRRPRRWSPEHVDTLELLAESAQELLELRRERDAFEARLGELEHLRPWAESLMDAAGRLAHLGGWAAELASGRVLWSDEVCALHEMPNGTALSLDDALAFYPPAWRAVVREGFLRCARDGEPMELEAELFTSRGRRRWVRLLGHAERAGSGEIVRVIGALQDVTRDKKSDAERSALLASLTATLESITDGFLTLDGDWRLTYVNSEAERLLGRDREGLLGRCVWDEFPDADAFREHFERAVREGQRVAFEERYAPMGKWFRVHAYPSTKGLSVYFQDVTTSRAAEDALRESEARFRAATQALAEVIRDWDLATDTVWWSEGLTELFGHPSGTDARGAASWFDRIPSVDRERVQESVRAALDDREVTTWRASYRLLCGDGREAIVDDRAYIVRDGSGAAVRLVGGLSDRTDRHRDQRRLREQAALLDAAQDAIIVRDAEDRITYWNRGAERLYGWRAEEVVGLPVHEVIYDDPAGFRAATRYTLTEGAWIGELVQVKRDRARVTVEARWTHVRDEEGASRGVLAINTDVTERLELQRKLQHAQRMEAVGRLTGGIAHDFNNLLTVVLGTSDILVDSLAHEPELAAFAEMARAAAQRGAELTHHLLSFARRQPLAPHVIDLNRLLADMDGLLRRALGEDVQIELIRGGGLWEALVDPTQLESAILNLCLNARDAMPRGGRLTIETANARLDTEYADNHAEVIPGQYVMVAVTDTGEGMTPEQISRAFEPFYTTKPEGAGTGLGLSMVYGFVKQSLGHVKIYSEVGEGTVVKLYLPRARKSPSLADADDSPRRALAPGGSERILLVEDDELVRGFAARELMALGYEVVSAADGLEALARLQADPEGFDLLFTDVVMPGGLNGSELAEEARQIAPAIAVLFTSGYTENAIVHHGRLDPEVLLLHKPYRRLELAAKVRLALGR